MSTYPDAEQLDSIERHIGEAISELAEITSALELAAGEAANIAYREAVKAGLSVDAVAAAAKVGLDAPTLSDAEAARLFAFCLDVLETDVPLLTDYARESLRHVRSLKEEADNRAFQAVR